MIQLLFPDYLKISLSILKKVFHNSVFDPQTTSFLCILAAAGSEYINNLINILKDVNILSMK